MARSHSHTLGEMIGNFFEDVMKGPIRELCAKYNVYFDSIGPRPARKGKKITWQDVNGNSHDLDYVIERNGTSANVGTPIAFIELAWRRYTKHSKNKAQEIAGAIIPITEKYSELAPFKGAILSGEFTESSLKQLENQGFHVLYIPFDKVVEAFRKFGVDIFFKEDTKEAELGKIVKSLEKCTKLNDIKKEFISSNKKEIDAFLNSLELSVRRQINYIFVLPLHGREVRFVDVSKAVDFLSTYSAIPADAPVDRYIVGIEFNDGSNINCMFKDKQMAINFLKKNAI